MTSEFNLLASGKDMFNADSALNSKTWEGETWKASQGNPLKFTMCTLLDQRFSKYIKIRICHFDQILVLLVAIQCVFTNFSEGVKMGFWHLRRDVKWRLCRGGGWSRV